MVDSALLVVKPSSEAVDYSRQVNEMFRLLEKNNSYHHYHCNKQTIIYWASEASPTLGCSIEISRDIYMCMCLSYVKLTA